jgi:pimeloyl-ACP methyl ester carboxylesterase
MLTHRVDGEGEPLVLMNGGLMSIGSWDAYVAPLSSQFRLVRFDFRGQLLTPGPYATSLAEHADDVAALLDHLGIDRARIAGASFGGEVAMQFAAMHPERVKDLAIITATDRTTAEMRREAAEGRAIASAAAAGKRDGVDLFRRVFETTWSDWFVEKHSDLIELRLRQVAVLPPSFYAGAAEVIRMLDDLDLTTLLPRIEAPTLVIAGEHDRLFPLEHSRAIAHAIPNARLEVIPDTGHGLLFERADRCIELLTAPSGRA